MTIGKLMVISIVPRSRPTSAAVLARGCRASSRTSSTVPDVFQRVGAQRHGPQRLPRPGAADEDRQVRLDRAAARTSASWNV